MYRNIGLFHQAPSQYRAVGNPVKQLQAKQRQQNANQTEDDRADNTTHKLLQKSSGMQNFLSVKTASVALCDWARRSPPQR